MTEGSVFDVIGEERRKGLLAVSRRRKFRRGEVIFHEGDPGDSVHVVEKGHVAIRTMTPLGETATLAVLGPGDSFGEGALLSPDSRRSATAVAFTALETRSLVRDEFERLRNESADVERFLTHMLVAQVRRLSVHLLEALYVPADKRVLRRVLGLCDSFRRPDGQITIPVTQDDIATMAGTSRPTANRVLKAAEAEGALLVGRGRVTVLDSDLLERRSR